MALQDRPAISPVTRQLVADAPLMSFFRVVQALLATSRDAVSPGLDGPPMREPIRFRPSVKLGFAASDIDQLEVLEGETEEGEAYLRYLMTVNFMGLYGPASPMPNHVCESILWGEGNGSAVRDFLDIFHHRLISFVYRAWERTRHYMQFDARGPDRYTRRALCLVGLGTDGQLDALGFRGLDLLRSAGLYSDQRRSAVGLEGLLRDYFDDVPVRVESCVAREAPIPRDQRMRLGVRSCRLGSDACLGERMRDITGAFQVVVGPLAGAQFREFLPGRDKLELLVRMVRFYVPDFLEFNVRLLLKGAEAPAMSLNPDAGLPLGQMSWMLPRRMGDEEVVVSTWGSDPLRKSTAAVA